jgi:type II secretory pathway component PulC
MNGPVAKAGSMPNLSSNNGTKVPIMKHTTDINATVTITPMINSTFKENDFPNNIVARISPFNKLSDTFNQSIKQGSAQRIVCQTCA